MPEPVITEDQANEALHQMLDNHKAAQNGGEAQLTLPETPTPEPAEPPAAEPEPAETAVEEPAPAEEPETAAPAAPPDDDVASLRQRLAERDKKLEEAEQRHKDRLASIVSRNQESQRILTDRHVRKSSAANNALRIFKQWKQHPENGVPEVEVDRVISEIEATMNPQSPSYVPPAPQTQATEDQAIVLNDFLNEKQMDTKESEDFGRWIKTEAPESMSEQEQRLAYRDLDGFLRLAHTRYQESLVTKANKRAETVEAVKTVQRTQKQAARAASAAPAAPRKTTVSSTPPNTVDFDKVTKEDVSKWVKQSVEQYR